MAMTAVLYYSSMIKSIDIKEKHKFVTFFYLKHFCLVYKKLSLESEHLMTRKIKTPEQ